MIQSSHNNVNEVMFAGQHLHLLRSEKSPNRPACLIKTTANDTAESFVLRQLAHEFEICRDLDLAGVLRPMAKETVEGRPAIVFEDPGGVTLAQLLATGPVELPLFLDVAIELNDIIGRLHRKGIVHKDIHSGNIIVCADSDPVRVYLTGLGIASLLPGQSVERTAPDKLEGTLSVISPEQTGRMNRPVDFRTDFYSLGAMLYQMLTGNPPFFSDDPLALVHAHLAIAPQAPDKINTHIPSMLSDLVLKLLAKDADDRYRSATGIAADLKRCRDDWHRTGTISAFELARQDVSETFHISDKLYGRQEEINTLQSAFERICGGPVELVLVTGYAGIGKTELTNQLRRPVLQQSGYFIAGKCDPLDRKIPCAPFVEAISEAVDQMLVLPQAIIDLLRQRLAQTLGEQGRVLTDVIPMLSLIIGEQPPVPELPPEQANKRFHLMLQRLFAAATVGENPVVLFLDDLQWADFSTLKMLETLACDTDLRNVLLIGAYREQEVDETHALARTLKEIEATGGRLQTVALGPMPDEGIQALIADALDASPSGTTDLAALCQQKTGGNPFFLKHFLLELVARKLIFFNTTRNVWQWHTEKIARAEVTDNVVELMACTIGGFDDHVQQALKTAACIGSLFDLDTLCAIHDQPNQILLNHLWPAVQSGLISLLPGPGLRFAVGPCGTATPQVIADDADKICFAFIHDRIQEAAYGLMADEYKMGIHLRIGRLLLEKYSQKHLDEKIFDILGQLNCARALIIKPDEMANLAELNLKAGQRARSLALFESAFEYFRMGIDLMKAEGWQSQYELTKELHLKGVEAAFVSGRYSEMDRWYETAVDHIHSPVETVDASIIIMEKECSELNNHGAIDTGLAILTRLGFSLPENPTETEVKAEHQETANQLHALSNEEILDLPPLEDPIHQAICSVLLALSPPAYYVNRKLNHIIGCKGLRLMLHHGTSKHFAYFLISYSMIVTQTEGSLDDAINYGRLSLPFLERYEDLSFNSRVKYSFLSAISPLFEPAAKTIEPLHTNYQSCLNNGVIEQAGSSLFTAELARFFTGGQLERVDRHMGESRKVLMRIRHKPMVIVTDMHHQVVLNLMGRSEHSSDLIGDVFDERVVLPPMIEANNETFLFGVYCCKLILAYLFEQFEEASGLTEKIDNFQYMIHIPWYNSKAYCFSALARLALCQTNTAHQHSAILKKVAANQKRLQRLADAAPMNYLHQLYLVKAECARVEGRILDAEEHFDRAIELAKENGYPQEQALANELAAKFWMGRGKKSIAQLHMRQALEGYTRWGATAKVRDLQEKHPEYFTEDRTGVLMKPDARGRATDLDMMSALRASQAISGEIRLDRLVEKLMAVVIENAGATGAHLLLETDGRFYVAAEAAADRPGQVTRLEKAVAMDQAEHLLPLPLVQYVQRTGKPLVIEDATAHERFGQDPYIVKNRPRSILCSPIVRKKNLIGLFYLENNLVADAFKAERHKMLEILSAQIAVSLENANLYESRRRAEAELKKHRDHLEDLVNDRTFELEVANKELVAAKEQAEAANQSKSEFLARMSHEIRTPLNAVTGLTNVVLKSKLTAEQRDYLNKVQIASNNLLEVINDILDFSKVEAGRLELAHDPFHLDQVMEQLADLFSNRVGQKDLELIFTMAPDVPRQLTGDAVRLTQILTNLVENAVKFTETGEIVVGVKTREEADPVISDQMTNQTVLKFTVSDTGIGITADLLPTLFDPFSQVEGYLTRKHEGTGLGLAICRRLVGLMGGRIWVESTPGRGSTFSFTVMLTAQKEERPRLSLPADLHGLKALVVDDSESSRQMLTDLLESFTFNVAAVDRGEKALAALQREPYQLVLLDWKMPGMDGIETARRIREMEFKVKTEIPTTDDRSLITDRRLPAVTLIIILVTAYGQEIVQERIDTASVDTMLLKPVKASQLFNTIMELFGKKEAVAVSQMGKPPTRPPHQLTGRRVLVVEDSDLNRDVAMALLEEMGLVIETAKNGQIAVDKVTGSEPGYYHAVLMDIQMPIMDGYQATRKIREWESQQLSAISHQPSARSERVPIVALTAHALKGEKEKCQAADMDDYIPKPLDEQELHRVLLKWMVS